MSATVGHVASPYTGSIYPATLTNGMLRVDLGGVDPLGSIPLPDAEAHGWRWIPASEPVQEAAALERQDAHYREHPRTEATS